MRASFSKPGSEARRRRAPAPARERTVAILGFHKVGPPPEGSWETWYSIPEETFVAQLRWLRENGWEAITLATFLEAFERPEALPPRAALITFDDGFRSVRDAALASLRRFGYPAVLFVATDFIGGRNSFDENTDEPVERMCDVEDLVALERAGVAVQSHGASHRAFSDLGAGEQEDELARSKAVLERALRNRVEAIAFPYGDTGKDATAVKEALRRTGYRAAFTYGGGVVSLPAADPYGLPRIAMGPDTDLELALEAG